MKIGIVLIATNSYIVLAVKFIKRFMYFYKGDAKITFYVFTDENPQKYLPDNINIVFIETHHYNWVSGTNSKFSSILSIEDKLSSEDYVFYMDSDTSVDRDFTEEWFIGESVAFQHYGDQTWMLENKGFERNRRSKAYVPRDTSLPQVYTYGAIWGGSTKWVMEFCKTMIEWQLADRSWGYEPGTNDESFSNAYFHYNPPKKLVLSKDFKFLISDKGGLNNMRVPTLDVSKIKSDLLLYKNNRINIAHGKVINEDEG